MAGGELPDLDKLDAAELESLLRSDSLAPSDVERVKSALSLVVKRQLMEGLGYQTWERSSADSGSSDDGPVEEEAPTESTNPTDGSSPWSERQRASSLPPPTSASQTKPPNPGALSAARPDLGAPPDQADVTANNSPQRAASHSQRSGRRRFLIGALAVLAAGAVGVGIVASGSDDGGSSSTDRIDFVDEPNDSRPPQSEVGEPEPEPEPELVSLSGQSQFRFQDTAGVVYDVLITVDGDVGTAWVVFDAGFGFEGILQDVTLRDTGVAIYLAGSNPRFEDGTPSPTYVPDDFYVAFVSGQWYISEVCAGGTCWPTFS